MFLMCIGPVGQERPAVRVTGRLSLRRRVRPDRRLRREVLRGRRPARLAGPVAERVAAGDATPFRGERIGAPIARPHQILCIGLNYRDHAAETGQAVPDEPILFTKSPTR